MFVSCWSVKGGVGTTVVAASLALVLARSAPHGVLLVDLAGDAPAVLGAPEPAGAGVSDWLAGGEAVPPDALARLEVPAGHGVQLVGWGTGRPDGGAGERAAVLAALLASEARPVVVDCGVVRDDTSPVDQVRGTLAAAATHSWLVTRACYLALRRAVQAPRLPSGIVVVREPGRALTSADIEQILAVPVVTEVAYDPAIARAVDAGLLAGRLPRALAHAVGSVA